MTALDLYLAGLSIIDRNFFLDTRDEDRAEDRADADNVPDDAWQTGQDRYEASFAW